MKKTLWSRLIVIYILIVVMVFLIINTYGMNLLSGRIKDDKKKLLISKADLIASEYLDSFYNVQGNDYLSNVLTALNTYLDIRVWIVNANGEVIADSLSINNTPQINLNELDPTFLENTISEDTILNGILNQPMLSYIRPVAHNYRIMGYIVLHTPQRTIHDDAMSYIDNINLCFLIFFPLLLLFFVYIYYITARPMKRLTTAAKEYSSGNFSFNFPTKGLSEYKELGDAISYMAGELNKLDDYQKKFVANISHDFRSPLTSIKGFAEAILDGTIPHEMQDKYLNIILFETERLNKLTSSLLELNRFETHGALLDIVSFDINHIIKKTAESFEGVCKEKKITLNLVFFSKETYVDADIGKIQQVLYNLIDNAIKFSPNNSKIKVSNEEKGDKIFVSVKDHGIGIPKESIKKIWERFYKTDPSRGKDKKGTGLGLSITREIIQAHNENINVISTEGVGTEFIFSLKKSPLQNDK